MSGNAPGRPPSSPIVEVAVTGTAEPALASPPHEPASAPAPPEPASALTSGSASALPPPENSGATLFAARPSLIRAMNEQLLLEHIRQRGPCSRAELARVSGLSKPTVSLALDNVERAGLVRIAGQRTGGPGRSARLYEIRPDAGLVLGLDSGHEYVRGAIADLSGEIRARQSMRAHATSVRSRVAELVGLADLLCESVGVARAAITQTVIGSPGVYDPRRNAMKLTGGLRGWDRPAALTGLREAFGPSLVMENDVDAAALAERALGHGREVEHFAFVHIGTGIGMGLVLGGQLLRGAHGVAGEIAFMPLSGGAGADEREARRRGTLEASASASGVVRAARRGGMRGPVSARRVFEAASGGDRPEGVTERDLVHALADGWGLSAGTLRYAPVGGGSYHWMVTSSPGEQWFVTVDDLDDKGWLGRTRPAVFAGLRAALDASVTLHRDVGLRFVVAPVPALDGQSLRPLGDAH